NTAGQGTKSRTAYVNVSPAGAPQTFLAVADARVNSGSPNANYATATDLRGRAGAPTYESYVRFHVSALAGKTVTSAKLRLFVTDPSDDGGSAYLVSSSWTETGITWANAPAIPESKLASAGAVVTGQWAEFDVTSAVPSGGSVSFAITSASTNSVIFS